MNTPLRPLTVRPLFQVHMTAAEFRQALADLGHWWTAPATSFLAYWREQHGLTLYDWLVDFWGWQDRTWPHHAPHGREARHDA